ncbi:Os08g0471150 [Oryza sativa Japonica Group]|uniref:Os08g0471150 protein n=1 Tax=Oryza sativa subsp. japonica TaxID=39947 RepID=A0A0P0XGN4_ORYSJ|nr:hypothetical protein EE612_044840 [Oryza sativa]BAT05844.1 Os08g0471150 [Oryza sativa Japonica Group]
MIFSVVRGSRRASSVGWSSATVSELLDVALRPEAPRTSDAGAFPPAGGGRRTPRPCSAAAAAGLGATGRTCMPSPWRKKAPAAKWRGAKKGGGGGGNGGHVAAADLRRWISHSSCFSPFLKNSLANSHLSGTTFLNPYVLSWRTKEEKLLCLK